MAPKVSGSQNSQSVPILLTIYKEALLDTMSRLKEAGLPYVRVGKNLAEAHQPVILEQKGTKVGFLAYCCVVPEGLGYEAEDDKPGYAPVRSWTIYEHVDPQPGT